MGDFYDKTDYLTETKGLLKDRINSLGGSITDGTTFRDYLVWLDSLYEALDEKTIIGLPDSLEGKCEQEGTPTPTSPQPINITTGRQVVSVCGKNLFDKDNITNTLFYDVNDGHIISSSLWSQSQFIAIDTTKKYTLQSSYTTLNNSFEITQFDINQNWIKGQQASMGNGYFVIGTDITFNSNTKYIKIGFRNDRVDTSTMMLEKGTTATTYEEYKGNDYEINLGKNLWNYELERAEYNSSGTKVSTNVWLVNTTKIPVLPNTTYSISQSEHPIQYRIICFNGATYLSQIQNSINTTTGYSSYTFTTPNNCNGIYIQFRSTIERIAQGTYTVELTDITNVQLEKGTYASSYSPYKTPIYLGKIGTYQDYIFRNTTENPLYDSNLEEGQWYIHKEIGRYEFLGTENFTASQWGTNSWDLDNVISTTHDATKRLIISNIFKGVAHQDRATSGNNIIYTYSNTGFEIRNTSYSTLTDIRNATKGNYIYWVLKTPTNTLIEDEELINQLNEIEIFTVISEDFYN